MILRKKTMRLALSALAVLLFLSLLTGCTLPTGPSMSKTKFTIDDFMVKTENRGGAEQIIAPMSSMIGIPKEVSGDVMLTAESTEEGEIYRFYNLSDGKLLLTVSNDDAIGFISNRLNNPQSAQGIFYLMHNNVIHIYNADGSIAFSSFVSPDGDNEEEEEEEEEEEGSKPILFPSFSDALNGFSMNGVEYYVRDGFVVYEDDGPLDSSYFNAGVPYLKYRYYIANGTVFVFNESGTLIYEYRLPSYAQGGNVFVLADGNIFVQYTYTVIDGEEHDFVRQGQKYKVVSLLANLERNTESVLNVPFLVVELHNAFIDEDFSQRYTERVSNLAKIIEIKNQRIDENAPARFSVLSNNLLEIFSYFDVVTGALDITRISYDRYLVTTAAGGLLVSGVGEIIGQLNNYRVITENFIMTSGKIYDHDLKEIFDLTKDGYTFFDSVGDNIILSKVVGDVAELYLFSGTTPAFISEASSYIACFEGYAVIHDGRYRYYNEKGQMIAETDATINWIYEKEEDGVTVHVGYTVNADGYIKYYRLQFHNAYGA